MVLAIGISHHQDGTLHERVIDAAGEVTFKLPRRISDCCAITLCFEWRFSVTPSIMFDLFLH
jgi:hypothetical protein